MGKSGPRFNGFSSTLGCIGGEIMGASVAVLAFDSYRRYSFDGRDGKRTYASVASENPARQEIARGW